MECRSQGKSACDGGLRPVIALRRRQPTEPLHVLQSENGQPLAKLIGHSGRIHGLDISADGKWLVSAANDHTALVWQLDKPGQRPLTLSGHYGPSLRGQLRARRQTDCHGRRRWPRDRMVFRGRSRGQPQQQKVFVGHQGAVFAVAFSPDSKQVASAGYDKLRARMATGRHLGRAALGTRHHRSAAQPAIEPPVRGSSRPGSHRPVRSEWRVCCLRRRRQLLARLGSLLPDALTRNSADTVDRYKRGPLSRPTARKFSQVGRTARSSCGIWSIIGPRRRGLRSLATPMRCWLRRSRPAIRN